MPDDFIEIISEGLMPDTSRTRLTISHTGKSLHQFQDSQVEGTPIKKSEFNINADDLAKINHIIDNSYFFDLESQSSDDIDGDQVQLTVTKDNTTHTVLLVNKPLKEFDDIIIQLNKIFPEKYRISYNSIIDQETNGGN